MQSGTGRGLAGFERIGPGRRAPVRAGRPIVQRGVRLPSTDLT
jgi:hypothetical protein